MKNVVLYFKNLIIRSLLVFLALTLIYSPKLVAQADENGTAEPAVNPESNEDSSAEPTATAQKPVEPKNAPIEATKTPVVEKSNLAKRLDKRLSLGANIGWVSMKSSTTSWSVGGASSIFGSWRASQNQDGKIFLTGRYAPYAGNLKYDDAYYDATGHAFLFGATRVIPISSKNLNFRLGGELGYLKVFANAQDGSAGDAKAKAGGLLLGATSELNWTFLEKIHAGPFLNIYFGSARIVHLGASSHFAF